MNQVELLNAARNVTGSDYATAKAIGVSRQNVSQGRNGIHQLDLSTIGALAEICGKDPLRTIAAVAAEREGQTKKGRNWRRWAGAAAVMLAVFFMGEKPAFSAAYADNGTRTVYTLCALILMIWRVRSNQRQQESWGDHALLGGVA